MAELHVYKEDMVSKDISSYALIIIKYTKLFKFFHHTTVT